MDMRRSMNKDISLLLFLFFFFHFISSWYSFMEHFPQRVLQIGRALSLLCLYVLYSVYKEDLQHNIWATHVFVAGISFFFSCSIFLCGVSALSGDNGLSSVKTTAQGLAVRLLRVSPVFLVSVVLYGCFVRDSFFALVDELYFQVRHMMLYGFPSTFITPSPPLYMVTWLVCMDVLLQLTCILVAPLARFVVCSLDRIHVSRSDWISPIGGITAWLVWYCLLYYPTKYSLGLDGVITPDTIGRLAHYTPIRCGECVFVALATYLSACSLGLAQTSVADIFLSRTCLVVSSTLSLLTVALSPFAGFTPIAVLTKWYLPPVVTPAACILLHLVTKMAMYSHNDLMEARDALPLSDSINSDALGPATPQSQLLIFTTYITSSPTLSLLMQCSYEMICMYPVSWVIAYNLNQQQSLTYHALFSLPFMVASAILLRACITVPVCALVRIDVTSVDLHLPAHMSKTGRPTSPVGPMRPDGYVPVRVSANVPCD